MSQLFAAEAAAPAADAAASGGALAEIMRGPLPMMLIVGVMFYFLFIRPQQKQAKERENLLKELKEGDKVVLVSGVYATVAKVEADDIVRLQIAEGVTIKAGRSAVERLQK